MPICPHAILFPDMSPNGLACQIGSKTFLLSDENLVNEYMVTNRQITFICLIHPLPQELD